MKKLNKNQPGFISLQKIFNNIKLLASLLKDIRSGTYKKFPAWALAAMALTTLYIIMPFDYINDFIPFLGQIDDLAIVWLCYYLIEKELNKYSKWLLF